MKRFLAAAVLLSLAPVQAFAQDAAASPAVTSASLNVRDFGARGDSATDDTAAFQKALDTCGAAGGGTVFVPVGSYMIRTHLNVPPYVTLQGVFTAPPATTETAGSTLLAVEGRGNIHAEPFLVLNRCAVLRGIQIRYPEQNFDDITPYPWCIRGHGDNVAIRDVLLVNPYLGVDFGTFPVGRHFISGLYGHPLKTGLFIDKCLDVGRVENVHFWPFGGEKAMKWTVKHGTAFIIAKTDWQYMTNCFAIAYETGFLFTANADGPGNAVLTQCGSDIGPRAVVVESVQPHSGVSFVNSQIMAGVEVLDSNMGPVKFTACGFWGTEDTTDFHARIRGGGHVSFTACHFERWALVNPESPAIIAESGGVTINACEFLLEDPRARHIVLGEDVEAAIITSNRFRTPPKIENRSEGEVEIANNVGGKPPRLLAAIEKGDAPAISSAWQKRMRSSPLTSHSAVLRLASAQGLIGAPQADLRRQLLASVAYEAGPAALVQRANDELRLETTPPQNIRSTIAVPKAAEPPIVDGKLDDEAWSDAAPAEYEAAGAGAPKTAVRLIWDAKALYLGARVHEPKTADMKTSVTRHDGPVWTDDSIEFFLAPRRTTSRYMQMIFNPVGAWYDGIGTLRSTSSSAWNAEPEIATAVQSDSWTVEMRLPWSQLGIPAPKAGDLWNVDFRRFRHAGGTSQYSSWSGVPSGGANHGPEQFGFLQFQ